MLASVTHIVLPIAPEMVPQRERGRAIGTVMMGLLLGILLARSFAGWVSHLPSLLAYVAPGVANSTRVSRDGGMAAGISDCGAGECGVSAAVCAGDAEAAGAA